jgi:hypothetical protein
MEMGIAEAPGIVDKSSEIPGDDTRNSGMKDLRDNMDDVVCV